MGNITSGEDKVGNLETSNISRKKLHTIFRHLAKESLSNIELISISRSLFGEIKGLNEIILYEDLLEKINLKSLLNDNRSDVLYIFLKKISNWPCLSNYNNNDNDKDKDNDKIKSFTLYDILILISIFNGKIFKKIGLNDEYFIHLIFIILISLSDNEILDKEIDNSNIDLIIEKNKIKWDLLPIVQSFDQLDNQGINKIQLNKFLNILLPLSIHSINSNSFNLNFTTQINSIISTFFLIDSNNLEDSNLKFEEIIPFNKFLLNYNSYFPHLFDPLNKLFKPLLYENNNIINNNKEQDLKIELNHKILNFQLLAQLSTILNIENLDITINSKPLYQGSKDGYSINSIQSHIINYRANTLLLISGKIINSNNYLNNLFFNKFPKFHPVLNSNLKIKEKSKFQIAIFITEPWRISNTKNFGSKGFKIIQLNPFQIILNSNNSLRNEFAYFSNIGGGLGFGSKPPIKSKDIKNNNLKFNIGGISLTIDNSLEMGNFRIEDMSNKSSTYTLNNNNNNNNNNNLFNDIWFKINEIEIYGLGNQQSLKDQKLAMEWEEREAERRRGLGNKDYQEGKALLELAGIIGGSQSGGSM